MKNLYILLLLVSLLFSSCGEDFFESTVTIDIPDHTPTLAVSCLVNEGTNFIEVFVSHSQSKNEQSAIDTIRDAEVKLLKGNDVISNFIFEPITLRYLSFIDSTALTPGSQIRIEVTHPDYESVFAEQVIPQKASIDNFEFTPEGTFSPDGEKLDEFKIEFTDIADQDNYYAVEILEVEKYFDGRDTIVYNEYFYLETNDPLVTNGFHPQLYFDGVPMITDASFPNKKYTLILSAYPEFHEEGDEFIIRLRSLSRERYLYLLSLNSYDRSIDNPFAEPVTVFGNIENGNGFFGAEAVTEIIYKF